VNILRFLLKFSPIFSSVPQAPRHNDFRWVGCPRAQRGSAYRPPNRILAPTGMPPTRRAALPPSRTLASGMAVHPASLAVASGAHAHGAAVVSLGPSGTRQGERETRRRHLQSKGAQRVLEAGAQRRLEAVGSMPLLGAAPRPGL